MMEGQLSEQELAQLALQLIDRAQVTVAQAHLAVQVREWLLEYASGAADGAG